MGTADVKQKLQRGQDVEQDSGRHSSQRLFGALFYKKKSSLGGFLKQVNTLSGECQHFSP
ncbi:MAG: hypothetical protein ACTSYI_15975 [Promethearchaeota archaeon]